MSIEITVNQLDLLVREIADKEKEIDAQAEVTKKLNIEMMGLQAKATLYLKELDREEYSSPFGKLKIQNKWRVNLPETDQDKTMFFDWLREQGIFDRYATVNSNSLNALYMKEWEIAKDRGEGMSFNLPGIPAPKLFEKLDFKPTKG